VTVAGRHSCAKTQTAAAITLFQLEFLISHCFAKQSSNRDPKLQAHQSHNTTMADLSDAYMSDAESVVSEEDFFESGDEENLPSPQKKTKAKPKAKGKATRMDVEETVEVLGENQNKGAAKPAKGNGKKKTVEEMYQKKTQLEHILLRPDTYSKFSQELLAHSFHFTKRISTTLPYEYLTFSLSTTILFLVQSDRWNV
jgi:hypothetical protein